MHCTDMAIALHPSAFIPVHLPSSAVAKKSDRPLSKKVRSPLSIPNQKSPHSKDEPENPQAEAHESAPR